MIINAPVPASPIQREGNSIRLLRIVTITSALALVVFVSITQQVSNDFWLQAKIGELILSDHAIPKTLLFPFTEIRDTAFNSHEWLPSILFYAILRFMGEPSLPFVSGTIACILFAMVVRLAYKKSEGNLPLAVTLGLLAIAAENYRQVLRPELLSLLLLVVCLNSLRQMQVQNSVQSILVYCLSTIIWANTHGSVVLAPMLAAAVATGVWLDRRFRPGMHVAGTGFEMYLILTAAAFLCTLITPSGLDLWRFVIEFSQTSLAKGVILEWIPTLDPRIRGMRGIWIGLTVAFLGILLLWRARRQLRCADVFVFFMFGVLGFKATRFLVYMGIAVAYSAAYSAVDDFPKSWKPYAALSLLITVLWLLVIKFGNAYGVYPSTPADEETLTPMMVKSLSNPELQGNVLVSYGLGAELIYRAYPRLLPSIDSRIDSYSDTYFQMHEDLLAKRDSLSAFVQRYGVRYILLDGKDYDTVLNSRTLNIGEWHTRSVDHKAILLEKDRDATP